MRSAPVGQSGRAARSIVSFSGDCRLASRVNGDDDLDRGEVAASTRTIRPPHAASPGTSYTRSPVATAATKRRRKPPP